MDIPSKYGSTSYSAQRIEAIRLRSARCPDPQAVEDIDYLIGLIANPYDLVMHCDRDDDYPGYTSNPDEVTWDEWQCVELLLHSDDPDRPTSIKDALALVRVRAMIDSEQDRRDVNGEAGFPQAVIEAEEHLSEQSKP